MASADEFFRSLSKNKAALDTPKPLLDARQRRAFKSCYTLLQENGGRRTSPQTLSRRENARQHLRNAYSLGAHVLLLFALSASITQLASIKHGHLFPRFHTWLNDQTLSQDLEDLAVGLIADFDDEAQEKNQNGKSKQPFPPSAH